MSGTEEATRGSGVSGGYFGARSTCYGVLHRPAVGTGRGVVLVNDFGYRGACAFWTFRRLAEGLAAGGSTVLRFDLPGTGDSPATPTPANRVASWQAAVQEAIEHLLAHDGLERVDLVGYGLGATLAFNAAQENPAVDSVELIQPFTTGERYLAAVEPAAPAGPELPGGRLVSFHFLTRDEEQSLRRLTANFHPREPALVASLVAFDGDDSVEFQRRAAEAGSTCRRHEAGDPARWLRDPMHNAVPGFFDGIADRLQRPARVTPTAQRVPVDVPLRPRHQAPELRYEEEVVIATDDGGTLHAILTTPASPSRPGALVVFFGTAANRRTGMHDNNTFWARALAEGGLSTLRFDATGFGDSGPRPGFPDNEVLVDRNFTDAVPLLVAMRARGFTEFAGLGLSSGGYNALKVALLDASFLGFFGINVARFSRRPTEGLAQAERENIKATTSYLSALVEPATWARLLRGEVDARRIGSVLFKRVRERGKTELALALARLGRTRRADLGPGHRDMVALLSRPRAAVQLVYAEGDRWLEEFEKEFGTRGVGLSDQPNFKLTFLTGVDHGVSSPESAAYVGGLATAFFTELFSAPPPL